MSTEFVTMGNGLLDGKGKLPRCPKCGEGGMTYWISTDTFQCNRCDYKEAYSSDMTIRFHEAIRHNREVLASHMGVYQ